MDIELNEDQVHALYMIESWYNLGEKQTFELAGGPGTGKTTLIRFAIEYMGIELRDVAFVAYMGKAAMQMGRNGLPAQTIHSFIYKRVTEWKRDADGHIMLDDHGKPMTEKKFKLKDSIPGHIKLIVVDEGSLVSEAMGNDLKSFGVPIIVLGDLNQLPPVFGRALFLWKPDYVLTKVMRQEENNPIIWLANEILDGAQLKIGAYGDSFVINHKDLDVYKLKKADMVITNTNRLRHQVNNLYRTKILNIRRQDIPQAGEKVICRKNNWKAAIEDQIYLTNGMTGTIDYLDISSLKGNKVTMDFRPDFLKKKYKNLSVDYRRFFADPAEEYPMDSTAMFSDQFEFSYAITSYLCQGSQWDDVIFMNDEDKCGDDKHRKKMYVAVTRAVKRVTIVI